MADDQRKGFWQRLKDKFKGQGSSPADKANEPTVDHQPGHETESSAEKQEQHQNKPDPVEPTPAKPQTPSEPTVLSTSELKTDNVGRVYAEALLELSQEQGVTDEIASQMQDLLRLVGEDGELHRLLINPAIADVERGAIIQRVFEGKVNSLLYKMLRVLCDKGRLGSLPQVAAGYLIAVADLRGQVEVIAYVATPLDGGESVRVAEQIGSALGKTVTLTQKVDESLIGGMKIKFGDKLIDASVASQLRNMKNNMVAAGRA